MPRTLLARSWVGNNQAWLNEFEFETQFFHFATNLEQQKILFNACASFKWKLKLLKYITDVPLTLKKRRKKKRWSLKCHWSALNWVDGIVSYYLNSVKSCQLSTHTIFLLFTITPVWSLTVKCGQRGKGFGVSVYGSCSLVRDTAWCFCVIVTSCHLSCFQLDSQ